MCGRYASTRSAADLSALFEAFDETGGGAADGADSLPPRYNVAPTDPVPLVRMSRRRQGRSLSLGRWGLHGSARMINARAETVTTTRAYAPVFAARRALVPADGWFEWRRDGGHRQAYFLTPYDGSVLAMAGLWAHGNGGLTFSVITTPAGGALAEVHDRMPLLLAPGHWERWLSGAADAAAQLLATPAPTVLEAVEVRPVGRAVGNVRNDGPELITRVEPPASADRLW